MTSAFPHPHELLKRYGFSAKKSWGQNFLTSERAYRAIVDATVADSSDWIVEIGSGLGTLTMRLAERVPEGMVIAVERDRDMVAVLQGELGELDNVTVEPANALTYDLGAAAKWATQPIAVCGNLPYQIASQILFRVIDARASVTRAVIMLQKEMADRIVADPGNKTYGALSVMVRAYASARRVVSVKASGFTPAPKVDSAVLRLDFLEDGAPQVEIANDKMFSAVVHAAFAMRRKTLRNTLRARFGAEASDRSLGAAAIDGRRRGETLSVAEFAALASHFEAPSAAPTSTDA